MILRISLGSVARVPSPCSSGRWVIAYRFPPAPPRLDLIVVFVYLVPPDLVVTMLPEIIGKQMRDDSLKEQSFGDIIQCYILSRNHTLSVSFFVEFDGAKRNKDGFLMVIVTRPSRNAGQTKRNHDSFPACQVACDTFLWHTRKQLLQAVK